MPIMESESGPMTDMTITTEQQPASADVRFLRQSLRTFNEEHVGPDEHRRLTVFLRDREGRIQGGLIGGTYWRWLTIEALWVASEHRGKGFGGSILQAAENEAVARGCRYVHLDTHSFQAVDFYRRRGYIQAGELRELPEGHSRLLFWKPLPTIAP
jgi:GNAT superfamily N-acetyltransferase